MEKPTNNRDQKSNVQTDDYSATQAPENRKHVESETSPDPSRPARPEVEVGMEALHHDDE